KQPACEQRTTQREDSLFRKGRPCCTDELITGNRGVSDPLKGAWVAFIARRRGRSRHGSSPIMIGTPVRGGTQRRLVIAAVARAKLLDGTAFLVLGVTTGASLLTKVEHRACDEIKGPRRCGGCGPLTVRLLGPLLGPSCVPAVPIAVVLN